jgi:hypothetical protein
MGMGRPAKETEDVGSAMISATDCGEYRQAAGAVAQDLRSRNPTWRPPTHATNRRMAWRSDGGPGQVQSDVPFSCLPGQFRCRMMGCLGIPARGGNNATGNIFGSYRPRSSSDGIGAATDVA